MNSQWWPLDFVISTDPLGSFLATTYKGAGSFVGFAVSMMFLDG
jgi:hypothetical protein